MSATTDHAKDLVRRYLEDVFTNGNLDAVDVYLAGDDFKDSVRVLVGRWRTAFPDLRITVVEVTVEDDRVVTEESVSGTHLGEYRSDNAGAIPPTGRAITWPRLAVRWLSDGKFVDGFWRGDELDLLQQMAIVHRPFQVAPSADEPRKRK